ncbi:MAG: hypothetical protein IKE22_11900, partial [Atopobiaceae bacterium]|nr:hypothetical protein [Atopobiaceae bacterium]
MELGRALGRRSIALFVSLAMAITLTPQSAYAETLDEDQAYEQLEAVEEGDTSDLLLVDDTASDADQNGSTDDVVDGEDAEEKASGEQEDAASNDAVDDVLDIEGLTDDSSSEGATSEVPNEEDDEASPLDIEDMPTEGKAVQEEDEPIALLGSSAAGYTWPLRSAGTVFNDFTSDHGGID